jgi:hypothetical protein
MTTPVGIAHVLSKLDGCPTASALRTYWEANLADPYKALPEIKQAYTRRKAELGKAEA